MEAKDFRCPGCGFRVFNRRYPRCEGCGAALPESLLLSLEEQARFDAGAQASASREATLQHGPERSVADAIDAAVTPLLGVDLTGGCD